MSFRAKPFLYLEDLVVPEELPVSIDSFRRQQSRWATGSFQAGVGVGTTAVNPLVNTQFTYLDVGVNVDITPHVNEAQAGEQAEKSAGRRGFPGCCRPDRRGQERDHCGVGITVKTGQKDRCGRGKEECHRFAVVCEFP